jgi:hypothetical protein
MLGGLLETEYGKALGARGLLFTLSGALGIAYTAWCWRGRSQQARSWAVIRRGPNLAMVLVPFFAFGLFGVGVCALFGLPMAVAVPFGLVSLTLFVFLLVGAGCPKWWGPGWYRRGEHKDDNEGKRAPHDALGALQDAYAAAPPDRLSRDEVAGSFGDARPTARWKGGWVHDPDAETRDHDLARKGTVDGELLWFHGGLGFAATPREDAVRGEPNVVAVPAARVTGVAVVPARAGADGRPRKGFWMRSPFSRLVVHTGDEEYVFDVARGRARKVATFIEEQTGQL